MKKTNRSSFNLYEFILFAGMTGGLWLKIIYTQFTIKINKVPIFSEENEGMFLMTLWSVLAVMLFLYLISYKKKLLLPTIGAAVLGFLIMADALYGRYYYNPVSFSIFDQLYMADNVSLSALSLLKWKDIIFVLDFLVLGMIVFGCKWLNIGHKKTIRYGRRSIVVGFSFILFTGLFTAGFMSMDKSHYVYERKYMARDLGLLYYHGYDAVKTVERSLGTRKLTDSQEAMIEAGNHYTENGPNSYTGRAEGYNLIVIQIEAFMNFLIDYEVEGVAVTPFLNDFKGESLYLSNSFVQTANGNTVDAELMMNTSLLPTYSGSVYYEYPTNTYVSLPLALKSKGYISHSFHSYEASFWNREVMHRTLGFKHFYSYDDFLLDEKTGWALSDRSFFRQALAITIEEAEDQPFYSMMITLSSHHPYDAFITGEFSDASASQGLLNHYYNAAAYVDQVIGEFIASLKEEGLYDNTLIVIYGDHSGLFNQDAVNQASIDGKAFTPFNWLKYQQVPVLMHAPGIFDEGLLIDGVSGQLDIMPTVSNLLGLEGLYTLGKDVLSPDYKGEVVKRYGDVITDDFIYISDEATVYGYQTGEVLQSEDYKDQITKAHEKLAVNDLILSSDYFKELMK